MPDDTPDTEIRVLSAAVNYDGSLSVMLAVPGYDDPVPHTLPGDTSIMMYCLAEEHPEPVDLDGTTAISRRCQELVARGLGRLNQEMARQHERMGRLRREHQQREDDLDVG